MTRQPIPGGRAADPGAEYAACRSRITALVMRLDETQTHQIPVPACPEWSVHDLVAHLVGTVKDVLAGRMQGVATDPWTAKQVEAGGLRDTRDLLADWAEVAPAFEELLDRVGAPAWQAIADVITHEHDLRGALDQPGHREEPGVAAVARYLAELFVSVHAATNEAVRVETDSMAVGPEDAEVVLRCSDWEAMRALAGRRSAEEMAEQVGIGIEQAEQVFTYAFFRPSLNPLGE